MIIWIFLSLAAVLAWVYLLLGRDGFWRAQPRLDHYVDLTENPPPVAVIIPARDEAMTIDTAVRSLLAQNYEGRIDVIVVDDQSRDRTAAIVQALVPEAEHSRSLELIGNSDRPPGWSGKLWAIKTGLDHLNTRTDPPAVLLLTDADIAHDPGSLSALMKKMVNERLDLVSVMVRLRNQNFWERFLIPPFVFFFQMLYPFPAVNEAERSIAAAAGGCVLVRSDALHDAGGIEAIGGTLIDDVALARIVKSRPNGDGRIWLGHAEHTVSLRAYDDLSSIWQMVVRTADTELDHSLMKLAGTVTGMAIIYLLPPAALLAWPWHQSMALGISGLLAWILMTVAFYPTLRLYQTSLFWAPTPPIAAFLYTLMTIDSARRYRLGRGGVWKGRAFQD
ncbi:MAG: glycosyltransferase [Pseudomonadota bacterium]